MHTQGRVLTIEAIVLVFVQIKMAFLALIVFNISLPTHVISTSAIADEHEISRHTEADHYWQTIGTVYASCPAIWGASQGSRDVRHHLSLHWP